MSAAPSTASSSLLIAAVRRRRPLWDPADVKHHDRVTVAGLWKQISAELGISTSECKNKWHSLRSSYARYLRDSRKPSGSLRCMKKWYLADAMSFVLGDFAPCTEESNVTQTIGGTHDEESQEDFNESSEEVIIDVPVKTEITAKKLNPRRIKRKPTAELMPAYFQSYPTPQSPLKEEEESIMLFMRSILPDLQQLDAKRQWKLKKKILQDVEELLEEQEKERSRPRTSIDPKDPHVFSHSEWYGHGDGDNMAWKTPLMSSSETCWLISGRARGPDTGAVSGRRAQQGFFAHYQTSLKAAFHANLVRYQ